MNKLIATLALACMLVACADVPTTVTEPQADQADGGPVTGDPGCNLATGYTNKPCTLPGGGAGSCVFTETNSISCQPCGHPGQPCCQDNPADRRTWSCTPAVERGVQSDYDCPTRYTTAICP